MISRVWLSGWMAACKKDEGAQVMPVVLAWVAECINKERESRMTASPEEWWKPVISTGEFERNTGPSVTVLTAPSRSFWDLALYLQFRFLSVLQHLDWLGLWKQAGIYCGVSVCSSALHKAKMNSVSHSWPQEWGGEASQYHWPQRKNLRFSPLKNLEIVHSINPTTISSWPLAWCRTVWDLGHTRQHRVKTQEGDHGHFLVQTSHWSDDEAKVQ